MSAMEDPIKPAATILANNSSKNKNVAKKSTSKSSLSRNGSFSSGTASPVPSLPNSMPPSREPSPEKKTALMNGTNNHVVNNSKMLNIDSSKTDSDDKLKDSGSPMNAEPITDDSKENTNNSSTCVNGDVDSSRKRVLDDDVDERSQENDSDNPAKQARMQIDSLEKKQEDMMETLTRSQSASTSNSQSREGSVAKDDALNGTSDTAASPAKSEESKSEEIVEKDSVESEVSKAKDEETSLDTDEAMLKADSDSNEAKESAPSDSVPSKSTDSTSPSKISLSNSFTLGEREKDAIKEMLAAAVSKVGKDTKDSDSTPAPSETCDKPSLLSSSDGVDSSGKSANSMDKGNLFERMSSLTKSLKDSGEEPVSVESTSQESLKDSVANVEKKDDTQEEPSSAAAEVETSLVPTTESTSPHAKVSDDTTSPNLESTDITDGKDVGEPDKADTQDDLTNSDELILLEGEVDNSSNIDESILDDPEEKPKTDDNSKSVVPSEKEPIEASSDELKESLDAPKNNDNQSTTSDIEINEDSNISEKTPIAVDALDDNQENSEQVKKEEICSEETLTVESDVEMPSDSSVQSEQKVEGASPTANPDMDLEMSATCEPQPEADVVDSVDEPKVTEDDVVIIPEEETPKRRHSSTSEFVASKKQRIGSLDTDSKESSNSANSVKDEVQVDLTNLKNDVEILTDIKDVEKIDTPKNGVLNGLTKEQTKTILLAQEKAKLENDLTVKKVPKSCSKSKTFRISKECLESLVQRRINAVLASPNQSQMLNDMQHRIDYLQEQLNKWKVTAKSLQSKITELTVLNRPERRRNRGPCRHVGVQVEDYQVQASLGQHISPAKKLVPRPAPHTPTTTPGPVPPSTPGGTPQTYMLPVASASANGSITLLTPSTLPPASANITSTQYRKQALAVQNKNKTVREMLDADKAAAAKGSPTVPSSPSGPSAVPTTPTPEGTKPAGSGVIDLTEEEEGSPGSKAAMLASATSTVTSTAAAATAQSNIRPGTFLVPMSNGQPILLQSIVNQQLRGAVPGTTLVYTGPRPPTATTGQPLVTLQQPVAGQPTAAGQVRSQLVVRQPTAAKPRQTTSGRAAQKAAAAAAAKAVPGVMSKHPAPLPPQPPQTLVKGAKDMPPKPSLKISRVPQGIVLSWNMVISDVHEEICTYQLYAYQEGSTAPNSSLWKRVGEVKALPLPMACTLTQFQEGNKYHFAVRALDAHSRVGMFSDPSSIHLEASPSTTTS